MMSYRNTRLVVLWFKTGTFITTYLRGMLEFRYPLNGGGFNDPKPHLYESVDLGAIMPRNGEI